MSKLMQTINEVIMPNLFKYEGPAHYPLAKQALRELAQFVRDHNSTLTDDELRTAFTDVKLKLLTCSNPRCVTLGHRIEESRSWERGSDEIYTACAVVFPSSKVNTLNGNQWRSTLSARRVNPQGASNHEW